MILFIFEGKDDKAFFEAVKRLFFPEKFDSFVCTYNSNIYSLYKNLTTHDVLNGLQEIDTVSVFKTILAEKGDTTLENIKEDEVSEIYLFFDYDFQEKGGTLAGNNAKLKEMLSYFTDETSKGKLYINYPMVEALRYTKELPDEDFWTYTVTRQKCQNETFKHQVHEFSFYASIDYLVPAMKLADDGQKMQQQADNAKRHWLHLIVMNVCKSNYICNGKNELPEAVNSQKEIYDEQLLQYVETAECKVAILSAFPLFLFDYFGKKIVD